MHFLPFSLTEPEIPIKQLDVIMRVKVNSIRMMQNQGYTLSDFESFLVNPDIPTKNKELRFYQFYEDKTRDLSSAPEDERLKNFQLTLQQVYRKTVVDPDDPTSSRDQTALVFFALSRKTGRQTSKALLVDYIKQMGDNNYNVGIMITEKPLNPKTKDDIDKISKDTLGMTNEDAVKMQEIQRRGTLFYHFTYDQMLYNVVDHFLNPKHTILDKPGRRTLINSGINVEDLPVISFANPVTRYIGAIPGDVIKIAGDSLIQTGSRDYLTYKIVRDLPKPKSK